MMNRFLFDARQELKRADHLIYVSLKYTRTIDVMNNILERLMNTFDFAIDGMLDKARIQGKLKEVPKIPGLKVEKVRALFPDHKDINDYLTFYLLLRKMRNSDQLKIAEFRRGVTMTCFVEGKQLDITIDIVTDYYKKVIEFIEYIHENFSTFFEEDDEDF